MKIEVRDVGLVVELSSPQRCLSNAVLGGGLGEIKTWLNLQVDLDYSCRDPQGDLRRAAVDMQEPVVGMLTAAKVDRYTTATTGFGDGDCHPGSTASGRCGRARTYRHARRDDQPTGRG